MNLDENASLCCGWQRICLCKLKTRGCVSCLAQNSLNQGPSLSPSPTLCGTDRHVVSLARTGALGPVPTHGTRADIQTLYRYRDFKTCKTKRRERAGQIAYEVDALAGKFQECSASLRRGVGANDRMKELLASKNEQTLVQYVAHRCRLDERQAQLSTKSKQLP